MKTKLFNDSANVLSLKETFKLKVKSF